MVIEKHKKEKIWKSKQFYINLYEKCRLEMEFTAELMPEGALT